VRESLAPEAPVADVARKYQICAQQLTQWRRQVRIPTKPAMHSNMNPATCSDPKPASVPI
jgi:transposase-like protein